METLVSFFRDGGIFMYFILIVSIVGFAIMVERGILLIHKYNVDGRALGKKVSKFLYEGNIDQARALCSDLRVPLMRILHHGITASANGSVGDVQTAIDEVALEIIPTIDKRVAFRPSKKRHRHLVAGDVNLIPLLNIFTIVIPFVLLTTVFAKTAIIDMYLPQERGGGQSAR